MRPGTFLSILFATLLALLAACSAGGGSGPACETEADCPARSRCQERLCVADAPPVARIAGPAHAVENVLATFDGSGSSDPDAGDVIVAWRWSLRPVDAACDAPDAPAGTSLVKVRFPCAGTWGVDLVVADALGTESAVASHEVTVAPWTGAPRVTAGEDVTLAHACAGEPLRCTTVDEAGTAVELALSVAVAADDADQASLRYAWTVTPPPGLALQADRRVVVTPGEGGSATAIVETDGAAIAGQWVFTVEVQDASGLIGTADQMVTIGNREPTITANVPETVDHRYDPSRRFLVGGAIPLEVVDPDGDPISRRSILARHLNDGPQDRFEASDDGDEITYYAEVRYDVPEDALHLIGPEVVREIEFTVEDVNGAVVTTTLPIVVGNNPPRPVSSAISVTVPHTYDADAATYRATATLTRWIDDDGDPIFRDEGTNNGACPTLDVDASGQARAYCALPFQGVATLAQFASSHVVDQRVRDPFGWGQQIAPATVTITNRSPTVTGVSGSASVTCTKDDSDCCEWDVELERCVVPMQSRGVGSIDVSPVVTDPDGDPVLLEATSCSFVDRHVCAAGPCSVTVKTCAAATCTGYDEATGVTYTATDGVLTASASGSVVTTCL